MTVPKPHTFEHFGEAGRNLAADLKNYVGNLRNLGTGTAAQRRVQHVENVNHAGLQEMLTKTRGYETTAANARRNLRNTEAAHDSGTNILSNPKKTFAKMQRKINDADWDVEHKSKFWVKGENSKILLSMRKEKGDRVRKFSTVTIMPRRGYRDQIKDKKTGKQLPLPPTIENLW